MTTKLPFRVVLFICVCVMAVSAAAQPAPQGPALSIETLFDASAAHPGGTLHAAVRVSLGAGWHVNAHVPADEYLVPTVLSFKPLDGVTVTDMVYPDPIQVTLEGSGERLAAYESQFTIGVALGVADGLAPGSYTLAGKLQYQACDTKQCFPPSSSPVSIAFTVAPPNEAVTPQHQEVFGTLHFGSGQQAQPAERAAQTPATPSAQVPESDWKDLAADFVTIGTASGYLGQTDFLAFLDSAESGRARSQGSPLADKSVWLVVLLVVGGGLLLNLTPCVLPLIPINLAIIGAGAKAGSRSRGFLLGGAYGVGIALTYGVLGLVVILGISNTFGAINATPWFNAAIAAIFVLLALAMFDVFLIDFTRFQSRLGIQRKEGGSMAIALVMGGVSALLAGACVAPVIISTIVYAQDQYTKGHALALILPFLIGVGMALPWPFAGAGLSFLPKPGKWMVRVKYAFGVFILLFALYYAHLAYSLFSDRYLVDRAAVTDSARQMDQEGWETSLSKALADAKGANKPVFIDFWATWCKNCLTMNQTTFKAPEVVARLESYVKVKYQAEDPSDPATKEVMAHFGAVGLPTYVVLKPR